MKGFLVNSRFVLPFQKLDFFQKKLDLFLHCVGAVLGDEVDLGVGLYVLGQGDEVQSADGLLEVDLVGEDMPYDGEVGVAVEDLLQVMRQLGVSEVLEAVVLLLLASPAQRVDDSVEIGKGLVDVAALLHYLVLVLGLLLTPRQVDENDLGLLHHLVVVLLLGTVLLLQLVLLEIHVLDALHLEGDDEVGPGRLLVHDGLIRVSLQQGDLKVGDYLLQTGGAFALQALDKNIVLGVLPEVELLVRVLVEHVVNLLVVNLKEGVVDVPLAVVVGLDLSLVVIQLLQVLSNESGLGPVLFVAEQSVGLPGGGLAVGHQTIVLLLILPR